jgi:hypothetical protein
VEVEEEQFLHERRRGDQLRDGVPTLSMWMVTEEPRDAWLLGKHEYSPASVL